jgi:hypothetical protein
MTMKHLKLLPNLFLLLTVLSACKRNEKATDEIKIPIGANKIEYSGHIYLFGQINDTLQGKFVFDTGADGLYFDSLFFEKSHFSKDKLVNANIGGAGNKRQQIKVYTDSVIFKVDTFSYSPEHTPIINLKSIIGKEADGIIGLDFVTDKVIEINYHKEFIKLASVNIFSDSSFQKIPLTIVDNRLYLQSELIVNDNVKIRGKFLLDLGYPGIMSLTSPTAERLDLTKTIENKAQYYTTIAGVGGEGAGYDIRAKEITIGNFLLNKPIVEYSINNSGAMANESYLGIIGNGILERFDVIIDCKNKYLYLKPNKSFSLPFFSVTSGLLFTDRTDIYGGLYIRGIYFKSNAEKEGIKIGDIITHINGKSVAEINYKERLKIFKGIGQNVSFTIKRNSTTITRKIKIENYL